MYLTFVILLFHMYKMKYCILLIHELQLIKWVDKQFFLFLFAQFIHFQSSRHNTLTQFEVWYHCCQSYFFLSLN